MSYPPFSCAVVTIYPKCFGVSIMQPLRRTRPLQQTANGKCPKFAPESHAGVRRESGKGQCCGVSYGMAEPRSRNACHNPWAAKRTSGPPGAGCGQKGSAQPLVLSLSWACPPTSLCLPPIPGALAPHNSPPQALPSSGGDI